MDLAAFEEDRKTYDAVERCLERISEAAAELGDMALHLMQDQPWHKIRTFGNVLRHEYDEIREDKLFEIVKSDLPGLHVEAVEALRRWNWSTNHSCEQSGTSASCAAFYPVSR